MKIVSDIKQVVVPRRLRGGVVSDSQLTPFRHNEPTTFESNLLAACRTLLVRICELYCIIRTFPKFVNGTMSFFRKKPRHFQSDRTNGCSCTNLFAYRLP